MQSCLDLQRLWGWLWSGSGHLALKRSAPQVNHFDPALSLRETHGPTWVKQDSKSKSSSVFALWHRDIGVLICCLSNPLVRQFYNCGLVPGWPQRFYVRTRPGLFPQQMKGLKWKSISFCLFPIPSLHTLTLGSWSLFYNLLLCVGPFKLVHAFFCICC